MQGGGALSPRKGGPGRGGHLSLPRTAAKQLPCPSHEQRCRDFFFLFHCEFIFFFFFFLLKPKTGWRLASRAGTSLPGTSAIPRGCGAGAGPTDASLAWWGRGRGAQGRAWGGTWTPGTGPRAFIWHQQTPTRQFPPTRVGKWEREERGPALPRPPADAGRTSSLCPHSRDRLKPREASPPPGVSSTKNWARNGSGCCKDLSYKRGAPFCSPAPPCPAGPHG